MHFFEVVAFYTTGTPYQDMALELKQSCEAFDIPCKVYGYSSRGSWVRNCAIKAEFLSWIANTQTGYKVYLDVDAKIRQYPKLFQQLYGDLGVHFLQGTELLSGTIFFHCERIRDLFSSWAALQQAHPTIWDQKILARAIRAHVDTLRIHRLPATYCQIYDLMKSAGEPVIEHFQASRKYKGSKPMMPVPKSVGKVRVRRDADGTIYITRRDRAAEKFLDEHFERLPNELRWLPGFETDNRIEDLKMFFEGRQCYIVGKGPSLDHLKAWHFTNPLAPVIAINEAIHVVEKMELPNQVFCLQQDDKLRDKCKPKRAKLLVENKAAHHYANYDQAYIFKNSELGLSKNALSAGAALVIGRMLGVKKFTMLCFDAAVNQELGYAKCVGYEPTWGGTPTRFLAHRRMLEVHAAGKLLNWIIPEAPAEASDDTPQPLQDSPEEHHEPDQEGPSTACTTTLD